MVFIVARDQGWQSDMHSHIREYIARLRFYAWFAHTMIKLVDTDRGSHLNPFPISEGAAGPSKYEFEYDPNINAHATFVVD